MKKEGTMWVSPRTGKFERQEWTVKWEGEENVSRVFGTQKEAEDYAKEHATTVKIQRPNGNIRQ